MTTPGTAAGSRAVPEEQAYREPPVGEASLGQLVGEVASDLSLLVRQEIELAKAELKQEAVKAGKGAGLLGAAGLAGLMLVIFLSISLMYIINLATPTWVAALLTAVIWGVAGFVFFTAGRKQLKAVNPTPEQTVETVKEIL